jgi:hypothetical protein
MRDGRVDSRPRPSPTPAPASTPVATRGSALAQPVEQPLPASPQPSPVHLVPASASASRSTPPVPPSLVSAGVAITAAGRQAHDGTPFASSGRPLPQWEPSPGKTHPTHDDVEEAINERSIDCDPLAYSINVLIRDLKFRRWDMQRHSGGDAKHRATYALRQDALRRLVDVARALACPYDPEADAEINRPHTHPTPYY